MEIEWDKIKSSPTKVYKIPGQNLLNLKEQSESQEKTIKDLTNTRNELSAKIDLLEKKITDLESEIKGKDEQLNSLEVFSNELKKQHAKELKAKNQMISELENSVSNKEEEIKGLNEDILGKNNKISELQDENSKLINKIPKIQNQISAKELEIENLKKEMAEKISQVENEIKSLKSHTDELQGIIKTKEDTLREKDKKIDELNKEINELNKKIEELNTEIDELKKQVPKKPVFEKAEEVIKGGSCPKCGFPIYEEYKIVEGERQLIRKYCPNISCGWTIIGKPKIAIALEAEMPEKVEKEIKIFKVKKDGLEETKTLNSKMVAIIADPSQDIIWIWKGKDSSRFEYAEATRQATRVKMEIVKIFHARIERVDEGEEPKNFPKLRK